MNNARIWIKGGQPYYLTLAPADTRDETVAALVGTVARTIDKVRWFSSSHLRIVGSALYSDRVHTWDIRLDKEVA